MKKKRLAAVLVFHGFIGGLSLLTFTQKDREFSENENRYLAKMPSISWESIKKGEFQDGFEEYIKDQIVFRDHWITVETAIQKACFNTDIGGAYVGKNGYDFEKITPDDVDQKQVNKNVKSLNNFFDYACEKVGEDNLYFILVPTSGLINSEKLPKNAILFDQNACMDNIIGQIGSHITYDVRELFKQQKDTQLYYKTDHHWTADGAYYAYQELMNVKGKTASPLSSYTRQEFDGFVGTFYSYSEMSDSLKNNPDTVVAYTPSCNNMIYVDSKGVEHNWNVIADASGYAEGSKYYCFIGGDQPYSRIDNPNITDGSSCVVIKESYGNAFVPFLVNSYQTVHVVDYRYYTGNLINLVKTNNIQDVIYINNANALIESAVKNMNRILTQ